MRTGERKCKRKQSEKKNLDGGFLEVDNVSSVLGLESRVRWTPWQRDAPSLGSSLLQRETVPALGMVGESDHKAGSLCSVQMV